MDPYFIAESFCLKTIVYVKTIKTIILFKQGIDVTSISLTPCRQSKIGSNCQKLHVSNVRGCFTVFTEEDILENIVQCPRQLLNTFKIKTGKM